MPFCLLGVPRGTSRRVPTSASPGPGTCQARSNVLSFSFLCPVLPAATHLPAVTVTGMFFPRGEPQPFLPCAPGPKRPSRSALRLLRLCRTAHAQSPGGRSSSGCFTASGASSAVSGRVVSAARREPPRLLRKAARMKQTRAPPAARWALGGRDRRWWRDSSASAHAPRAVRGQLLPWKRRAVTCSWTLPRSGVHAWRVARPPLSGEQRWCLCFGNGRTLLVWLRTRKVNGSPERLGCPASPMGPCRWRVFQEQHWNRRHPFDQ